MKVYKVFFIVLSLAQLVFTLTWFFLNRKFDRVILLSSIIYAGSMAIGYITQEVEKYRRRKKELIDNLP